MELRGTAGTAWRLSHCPDLVIWPPATPDTPPVTPDTPATPASSTMPVSPDTAAPPEVPTPPVTSATPSRPQAPGCSPPPQPLPVAIEVELTIKAKAELIANCRAWARCRYVEAVIYFAEKRDIGEWQALVFRKT